MKKTKKILSLVLALLMLVSVVPMGASGANVYVINDVTVSVDDFSSTPDGCWDYANNLYKKIWGVNFSSLFEDESNCLRNLSDDQLLLNEENLRKFVSFAPLGACLRISSYINLHSHDGWVDKTTYPGHNLIIVQKDANGFTALEGGWKEWPHKAEKYYTWSNLCDSYDYEYIKYIKWPNAEKYKDEIQTGDIIEFGSYPQTEEKDEATINALNSLAPAWDKWTSYGYYSGDGNIGSMKQGNWMRYVDVPYGGSTYRGVKFTKYRPKWTIDKTTEELSFLSENGFKPNEIKWFKFEPIKWRVLDDKTGFVMSELLLDSQPYNNNIYYKSSAYYNNNQFTNYVNKYETSSIREWLNIDFYETAFSPIERNNITINPDRVYLLSYNEVTNSSYGFNSNGRVDDNARKAKGTDYAKSQGLFVNPDNGYSYWRLRSAYNDSICCLGVLEMGYAYNIHHAHSSYYGIRPAIVLKTLDVNAPCKHTNSVNQPQINPNCIDIGYTAGVYCNDCATWLSGHEVIAVGDHKDNTGDGKCDTCLKQLSTPSEPEQPKKNIVQKVVDAVKNAFNNVINFFKKLFGR